MNISLESPGRLVIVLSHSELQNLGLTYQSIDYSRENSRTVIQGLLSTAAEKTGFDPKGGRLVIEVFPSPDMGCILCFSKSQSRRLRLANSDERVYEFSDSEHMMSAMEQLYKTGVKGGSLYEKSGKYRLLLLCKYPSLTDRLICEFAVPLGKSKGAASYTKEHWQKLCDRPAQSIGMHICKNGRR